MKLKYANVNESDGARIVWWVWARAISGKRKMLRQNRRCLMEGTEEELTGEDA